MKRSKPGASQETKGPTQEEKEFFIRPLIDSWREEGKTGTPSNLDEAAVVAGYKDWLDYCVIRNRQWLLTKIPDLIAKGESKRKEAATGQIPLF